MLAIGDPIVQSAPGVLRRRLLSWYDRNRRELPWRSSPGETPDPYRIWVSEIMLQQTTVATVGPYFADFMARWPTVEDLAAADLDAVLHAWQGLGYYARARNMHACARVVAGTLNGRFPDGEEGLRRLPGVGAYTAAAIAAIAFGRKAAPVDGNVLRVLARLHGVEDPLPVARDRIEHLARALIPAGRPGDFAQALMDLGATVCTPRGTRCGICPWEGNCAAFAAGRPEAYPARTPKKERPVRRGAVFWVERDDGSVLLRRRPAHGLLGGMMEFPSTEWRQRAWTDTEAVAVAPVRARWRRLPGTVRHTFSHFHLELAVFDGHARTATVAEGIWCPTGGLSAYALPSVMKKVARHALLSKSSEAAN
jgi:A/G-specific adenine glycosylase